ncbi:MAG: ammonium transporter [Alphaproteobacteria bacterium GM202ARS2]|nr:ammonium transporter [Alphaproteobacteria bacterium GM202ARS2]
MHDPSFILNSINLLFHGALVMFMAAGFTMLEAGLVRRPNMPIQCRKNLGLFAISAIAFLFAGYNLMFHQDLGIWQPRDIAAQIEQGYADHAYWFFQMVFVATTASIVSGAVAERMRLLPFLIFTTFLAAFIYPIQGSWSWGGGFLNDLGFIDFAGSTVVHSVGGWAALTGVIILGPRKGFGTTEFIIASKPLATLGAFILCFGWLGFNGGSQITLSTTEDVISIATIYANTIVAATAGVAAVIAVLVLRYGDIQLSAQNETETKGYIGLIDGALGGLVAITAYPLVSLSLAVLVGALGGLIAMLGGTLLRQLKIDDVVGAIPVHLFAGIFGTLAVCLSHPDANIMAQAIGIICVGAFTVVTSSIIWLAMKYTIGIRRDDE